VPGKVIQVRRHEYTGWAERLYLPMIAKGLAVTSRHFFRNLRGFITGRNRSDFVVQYPEERVDYPDAFRGMPVLVQLDNGQPRCVACGLCEFACPTDCISIVPGEIEGARIERYPEAFDIDMSRCMLCGLCEEACPEEAIVMSREVEIASFDRGALRYRKEDLLVPENLLERRLDFLRSEYDRAQPASAAPTVRRPGRTPRTVGTPGDCGSPVLRRLLDALPEAVRATHADFGDATASVTAPSLLDVLGLLRDDPELEFEMLTDVTAVDYLGETPRFEVVYHLYSASACASRCACPKRPPR
jgi:NADH-quinone oxidoreductase subunit I